MPDEFSSKSGNYGPECPHCRKSATKAAGTTSATGTTGGCSLSGNRSLRRCAPGISKATEAGTSDLLSIRHVNLVRFNDDLQTIVPDVAKSWHWNQDYTVLTMQLRKGHRWSDGKPFTAQDIVFWYNYLILDPNITQKPKDRFLSAGKPMKVEALNDETIRFTLNAPKPGLLTNFALDYAQPFQPKHLLAQFDPKLNKDADRLAQSLGFKDGYTLMKFYYGQSDWKDIPTPLLKDKAAAQRLVKLVTPRFCRRWKPIWWWKIHRTTAIWSPIPISSRLIQKVISYPISMKFMNLLSVMKISRPPKSLPVRWITKLRQ